MRTGKMTTIIFIRDKNSNDQEVSGYIDYAQRLRTEDFTPYFEKRSVTLALTVTVTAMLCFYQIQSTFVRFVTLVCQLIDDSFHSYILLHSSFIFLHNNNVLQFC